MIDNGLVSQRMFAWGTPECWLWLWDGLQAASCSRRVLSMYMQCDES